MAKKVSIWVVRISGGEACVHAMLEEIRSVGVRIAGDGGNGCCGVDMKV